MIHVPNIDELKQYYKIEGYRWDDPKWEKGALDILNRYLPLKNVLCECKTCNKKAFEYKVNMAGEIINAFCKQHYDEIMPHLRSFNIL